MKCPRCGRFVKNAIATFRRLDDRIVKVEAECKKHGIVQPEDWDFEDFGEPDWPDEILEPIVEVK